MNNTVRGLLFEAVVKKLLEMNDYSDIPNDGQTVRNGKIRGRGTWHQIDAFGRFSYTIPFIYPIRLIAEAKWYTRKKVGLNALRNFVGTLKDISENYFVEDGQSINEKLLLRRYTDCGAVFSANGFSKSAQGYAYAQGVFLVSYENHPIIKDVLDTLNSILDFIDLGEAYRDKRTFFKWFYWYFSDKDFNNLALVYFKNDPTPSLNKLKSILNKICFSAVGIASGIYPIHLLSYHKLPEEIFKNTDEQYCKVYYTEKTPNVLRIRPIDAPEVELVCSIPREIVLKYTSLEMLKFKRKFFQYIDVPIRIGKIRRILRLSLDEEWVKKLEDEAKVLEVLKRLS